MWVVVLKLFWWIVWRWSSFIGWIGRLLNCTGLHRSIRSSLTPSRSCILPSSKSTLRSRHLLSFYRSNPFHDILNTSTVSWSILNTFLKHSGQPLCYYWLSKRVPQDLRYSVSSQSSYCTSRGNFEADSARDTSRKGTQLLKDYYQHALTTFQDELWLILHSKSVI